MKTIAAGKFKNTCLKMLDEVARERMAVVITKRGRPIARLVPVTTSQKAATLAGSIIAERGDPFSTAKPGMAIVLDTHAWLWWVARDGRVSRRASTVIRRAQANETLWLSLISTWEVAKKVERGQLALDRPLDEWLAVALATPGLQVAELTRSILIDSCRLPQPFHGDPADQMIVATARAQNAAIVTRDARIREYAHVRTIW